MARARSWDFMAYASTLEPAARRRAELGMDAGFNATVFMAVFEADHRPGSRPPIKGIFSKC